jgi:hypothetical protein
LGGQDPEKLIILASELERLLALKLSTSRLTRHEKPKSLNLIDQLVWIAGFCIQDDCSLKHVQAVSFVLQ